MAVVIGSIYIDVLGAFMILCIFIWLALPPPPESRELSPLLDSPWVLP